MNKEFESIIKGTNRTPVFVDLNNILYRYFYTFGPDKFKSRSGVYNGHLFGLCQILRTLDKLNYEVFLCEDSSCTWRKQLNENYKSNRNLKENNTEFWKDYPIIRDLISNLEHTHSLRSEGYEADDLMFTGAKLCSMLNINSYIFSTDKDLLQALDTHIKILHKVTLTENEEIDENSDYYTSKFPVAPKKLPLYRAFKGDPSDNIEAPIKRFPKDLILSIIDYLCDNNGVIAGYVPEKISHIKWIKQLCDNWDKYISNYKLMKLNIIDFEVLEKSKRGSYIKVCQDYDLFQFLKYCSELA
jgi:5'-3' exonuclease